METLVADTLLMHLLVIVNLRYIMCCVAGDQAKCFFLQSGLPTQTLGRIWLVVVVH